MPAAMNNQGRDLINGGTSRSGSDFPSAIERTMASGGSRLTKVKGEPGNPPRTRSLICKADSGPKIPQCRHTGPAVRTGKALMKTTLQVTSAVLLLVAPAACGAQPTDPALRAAGPGFEPPARAPADPSAADC